MNEKFALSRWRGIEDLRNSAVVEKSLKSFDSIKNSRKARIKDKSTRATVEQVLDPRTRLILYRLINKNYLKGVNGCVSTGKEANVYHALKCEPDPDDPFPELAIKVYKTSILVFKDRDRYVNGEYRFRNGYSRHNPRMMVRLWAEKEMRNLIRINNAGIPSPRAILLRRNVVIMSFIGKDGVAAPLLKNSILLREQYENAYDQIIRTMRIMFHKCHLVHSDLSPYNILYYENVCYVIDVGQAVEYDHPTALEFLRRDIYNINSFFLKNHVSVLTNRELFDFICDINLSDEDVEEYLDKLYSTSNPRSTEEIEILNEKEDQLFMNYFIPRTLAEVSTEDFILDRYHALIGDENYPLYYRKLIGLNKTLGGATLVNDFLKEEENLEEMDSELRLQRAQEMKNAYLDFKRSLASFDFFGGNCDGDSIDKCSDDDFEGIMSDFSSEDNDDDEDNSDDHDIDDEDNSDHDIDDKDNGDHDIDDKDNSDHDIDDKDNGDHDIDDKDNSDHDIDDRDEFIFNRVSSDKDNDDRSINNENIVSRNCDSSSDIDEDNVTIKSDSSGDIDNNDNITCNSDDSSDKIEDSSDDSEYCTSLSSSFAHSSQDSSEQSDHDCSKGEEVCRVSEILPKVKHQSKSGKKITDLPKDQRKAHKKLVKQQARKRRETKIPKHVKKRAHKVARRKR